MWWYLPFYSIINLQTLYTSSFPSEPQQSMAWYHQWTETEVVHEQNHQVFLYRASETAHTPWIGKEHSGLSCSFCLLSSPRKDCRLKARAVGARYVANELDMHCKGQSAQLEFQLLGLSWLRARGLWREMCLGALGVKLVTGEQSCVTGVKAWVGATG